MTNEAKNLFVMCAAYYLTYLPVVVNLALRSMGLRLPDAVKFAITWIYVSSSAVNGFLYIALHSSVRRELRRYLPRCRHTPSSNRRTFGTTSWRRLRAAALDCRRHKHWNIWSTCNCDDVTLSTRDRATADSSPLTM